MDEDNARVIKPYESALARNKDEELFMRIQVHIDWYCSGLELDQSLLLLARSIPVRVLGSFLVW